MSKDKVVVSSSTMTSKSPVPMLHRYNTHDALKFIQENDTNNFINWLRFTSKETMNATFLYCNKHYTLLHWMIIHDSNPFLIKLLLASRKLEINMLDKYGKTALHYLFLSHSFDFDLLKYYVESSENKPNISLQDEKGNTVLHIAILRSFPIATIDCLIKNGANLALTNHDKFTPLFIAIKKNNKEIIDLLVYSLSTDDLNKMIEEGQQNSKYMNFLIGLLSERQKTSISNHSSFTRKSSKSPVEIKKWIDETSISK